MSIIPDKARRAWRVRPPQVRVAITPPPLVRPNFAHLMLIVLNLIVWGISAYVFARWIWPVIHK